MRSTTKRKPEVVAVKAAGENHQVISLQVERDEDGADPVLKPIRRNPN